jgi:ubiquinone biosynthesis protein
MRQLMEENFFHADLHPGNIILLRSGRFALIDLGSVGSVDRQFLGIYQSMMRSLGNQDFAKAVDLLLHICANVRGGGELEQMRAELIRSYRDWAARVHVDGLPYHERNVLAASNGAGRILARYGVAQSWDLMKLGRAWATVDASLNQLFPNMNYIRLFRAYFAEASARRLRRLLRPGEVRKQVVGLMSTIGEYNLVIGPMLRTPAFVLRTTASKLSRVGIVLTRALKLAFAVALLIVAMNYIDQHHPATSDAAGLDTVNPLSELELPLIRPLWWGFLFVGMVISLRVLARVQRELARRD